MTILKVFKETFALTKLNNQVELVKNDLINHNNCNELFKDLDDIFSKAHKTDMLGNDIINIADSIKNMKSIVKSGDSSDIDVKIAFDDLYDVVANGEDWVLNQN